MSEELIAREERYQLALRDAVQKLNADGPHLILAFSRRVMQTRGEPANIRAMSDLDLVDLVRFGALGLADAMLALRHCQEESKHE